MTPLRHVVWTPAELDFGVVVVNTSSTLDLTASWGGTGHPQLDPWGQNFYASLFDFSDLYDWWIMFSPMTPGPQSTTVTWDKPGLSCPFIAKGIGIVNGAAGCGVPLTAGFPGAPCGQGQVCGPLPGQCVTELVLTEAAFTFTPGTAFSGVVATGTDAALQATGLSATIDWGDATAVSAGTVSTQPMVDGSLPISVSGSHMYATGGTFQVTVTVTDSSTSFSASTTYQVSQ